MRTKTPACRGWLTTALALAASLLAANAPGAPASVNIADYRGSDDVLLRAGNDEVTVREFLIYALETGQFNPVRLKDWDRLEGEQRNQLREALRSYLKTRTFAARHEAGDPLDVLLRLRAQRITAAPVAQMIWADEVVRDSVVIFPEDVYHYYAKNAEQFTAPSSVRIRRLRVPIASPVTTEAITSARNQAQDLRLQAIREGGLESVIARNPDLRVDPPGETLEITRGGSEATVAIQDRAFQLGLAQISEPIQTRTGFFLIEVQDKTRPEPAPLPAVRDEIISSLRTRFVPQQFDYLSGRELTASHAVNRAWLFPFLPDDADLVRVRDFSVKVGEFKTMFPDLAGAAPNTAMIRYKAQEIVSGEIATQDLEEKNRLDDPFYAEALDVANTIYEAKEYVFGRMAEIQPSPEEVEEFLDQNPEQVFPSVAKVVWKYEIVPRDPGTLRPGELDSLQILMRSYLSDLVNLARQHVAERREVLGTAVIDPETATRNIPEPDDRRVHVRLERLGTFNRRQAGPELVASFDELVVGEFTEPRPVRDGSVVSYYVSEETQSAPPPREALLELSRQVLTQSLVEAEVVAELEALEDSGRLEFHPALNVDPTGQR